MSRAFLILSGEFMRERAIKWIRGAPAGTGSPSSRRPSERCRRMRVYGRC